MSTIPPLFQHERYWILHFGDFIQMPVVRQVLTTYINVRNKETVDVGYLSRKMTSVTLSTTTRCAVASTWFALLCCPYLRNISRTYVSCPPLTTMDLHIENFVAFASSSISFLDYGIPVAGGSPSRLPSSIGVPARLFYHDGSAPKSQSVNHPSRCSLEFSFHYSWTFTCRTRDSDQTCHTYRKPSLPMGAVGNISFSYISTGSLGSKFFREYLERSTMAYEHRPQPHLLYLQNGQVQDYT